MNHFDLGQNWNGTRTKLHVSDDELIMQDVMDAQPILDHNAQMRNESRGRRLRSGHIVASIPVTIYYEWRKEWRAKHREHWEWHTYVAMKVNSRDWCKLRTTEGRM